MAENCCGVGGGGEAVKEKDDGAGVEGNVLVEEIVAKVD